jgi:hypothetical protein
MEAQDFEDPEVHHRHLSHLFGLYPGHTITMQTNPEICEAIANSLRKRGLYNITNNRIPVLFRNVDALYIDK